VPGTVPKTGGAHASVAAENEGCGPLDLPSCSSSGSLRLGAHVPVRARSCCVSLLFVEYQSLVARGAAQLHTRVVYRQRFAVR
jgi:hypothetical protein